MIASLERATPRRLSRKSEKPLILVVEDQEDILLMFSVIFSGHFRIAAAKDGEAGYRKALELKPDLIITDIRMPRMNGEELVKSLREDPMAENVPILVITGCQNFEIASRITERFKTALKYLEKPFSISELFSSVESLLCAV